jgi:alkaline phosphatase
MRLALAIVFLLLCAGCTSSTKSTKSTKKDEGGEPARSTTAAPKPDPQLLLAGDIASCGLQGDEASAAVVQAHPDAVVAAVGDLAYDRGTEAEFRDCYGPSWGQFKDRTHPAPGNHEYETGRADAYFAYWGEAAGPAGKGWYSYDVGAWHVVALNSTCEMIRCGADSEQGRWLAKDLADHAGTRCTLAYWHYPRWSSGPHGSLAEVDPLWAAAVAGKVDVVVNGHDHDYERFAPRDGVREFVVGTGGASAYPILNTIEGSEVHDSGAVGVLALTLHAGSYDWRFLGAEGVAFTDSGSGACH